MSRGADDDLKAYDLEHYDSDAPEGNGTTSSVFSNIKSLAYHESNADDPYITLKDEGEDDEEREELQILSTDNLVIAARVEDEVPFIEVYVYEDEADNLYVHHDIMLPAIPLCIEWINSPVGKTQDGFTERSNHIAVGTFDPDIEIWDLDTIDGMYPSAILGPGVKERAKQEQEERKRKASGRNQRKQEMIIM